MNLFKDSRVAELQKEVKHLKENKDKVDPERIKRLYDRAKSIAKMHYEAAKTDRTRADWGTTTASPYRNINGDLGNLIARSRYAYDNDAYYHSAINSIVNNVICTGMRPKAMVMQDNGKPAKTINKALDDGWKRYNDEWDRRGMMLFNDAQRLALKTIAISGGILSNTVKADDPAFKLLPIAKQLVEPDRLDKFRDNEQITILDNKPVKQTLHGISMDEYGKPMAYWINGLKDPIRAKNIVHAFVHDRPDQHIGVPWGAQALDAIWDVHQLNEDTLVKSRALADILFWFKSTSDPWDATGDKDSDDNRIIEKLMSIKTEEKPEVIQGDDSITESVKPLTQMILQSVFASLGTSYMTVTRDMEGVNFAASRAVIVEERQMYKALQKWFAKSFCQKEWQDYVWWMVFTDQLPGVNAARYMRNAWKYSQCWWRSEGWAWIDPLKDARAEIEMQKAGLKSDRMILAGRGVDLEDHYRDLQEQIKLRESLGISGIFTEQSAEDTEEPDATEGTDEEERNADEE